MPIDRQRRRIRRINLTVTRSPPLGQSASITSLTRLQESLYLAPDRSIRQWLASNCAEAVFCVKEEFKSDWQTMSEDETKVLQGKKLEQILTKLEVMDARLQRVEARVEERGYDTRPIWERALVEIMEVRQEVATVDRKVATVDRKIDVFSRDIVSMRAEQLQTDERIAKLESENDGGGMTTRN